ncbi:MAG: hypothetical protein HZB23_07470 [Deltaproteobacteria bacterium]|nr:hypothetical protein [Deltaproteobacteria bacterium]
MNAIIIKNDGTIRHPEKKQGADILSCLGMPVVLERGFTLAGFFRLIKNHPDLARLNDILPDLAETLGGPESPAPRRQW